MPKNYNVISFFAGVGGIDLGFEQTGQFKTVYANEFDKNAQETFVANYGDAILDRRDIHEVEPSSGLLGEVTADVLLAGFPCQAFSIAGYRKGFDDARGDLFFETMRIIKSKHPQVVFLENVKNLVTHDNGNTFRVIREFLIEAGYHIKWAVLNAKDHGNIPQNRERIYVVGFKSFDAYENFAFPGTTDLQTGLRDVIDFSGKYDSSFYYAEDKQPFFRVLQKEITSQNTTYQWRRHYVRENKAGVVPTLTANMGTGGHNVPLIFTDDGRIRKLTPRETFNVQGYPRNFKLPETVSRGQLYKQAGNSVAVPVIRRIAENIALALEKSRAPQAQADIQKLDSYIVAYTKMDGKMRGESFGISRFATLKDREFWLENQLKTIKLPNGETIDSPELLTLDTYSRALNSNRKFDFISLIG